MPLLQKLNWCTMGRRNKSGDDRSGGHFLKTAENHRKHGISFEEAVYALGDPYAVDRNDDRFDYGEERLIATGMASGKILTVIYTARDENLRIISARKATRREQKDYYLKIGI